MTREPRSVHAVPPPLDPRSQYRDAGHEPLEQRPGRGHDAGPRRQDWQLPALPRSVWVGLFVATFGVLLMASGMRAVATHRRLATAGVTTTATVIDKQVRSHGEMDAR